jgi:DNA (cytosine-5)-methyltransferase 1
MALRPKPPVNVLSLCAGVGGLELGIRLALPHARSICFVEREAAAAASLVASMEAGWFHPAPVWSDMLTFDARPWRGLVHILASGDPCQDNSVAGKRAGAAGARFLAPEVCRLAEECRPDLIFRENVPGNADGQLEAIVPPLERLGYRVAAGIFSSAETGNTMRRERLFIMAECDGVGFDEHAQLDREPEQPGQHAFDRRHALRCGDEMVGTPDQRHQRSGSARGRGFGPSDAGSTMAGASSPRPQGDQLSRACDREQHGLNALGSASELRRVLLPPAIIPGPDDAAGWRAVLDRFPEYQPALSQEEAESHLRRGIDAMAHRTERLRATGNGVDPVVAAYAFLRLRARLAEGRAEAGEPVLMGRAA